MTGVEATIFGTFGMGIIGFMWKMSMDLRAISEKGDKKIETLDEDHDKKRDRVYQRLDEVKEDAKITFVRKDVCQVMHAALTDKVDKIDKRIENSFTEVFKKIDELIRNGKEK